ncbi:MAG: hypothetical protein LBV12_10440 [Puniceicoccales bacterium]|jgi:hypothetical protein|nr:hypothetical protein [Puniceicoccales bacterium]
MSKIMFTILASAGLMFTATAFAQSDEAGGERNGVSHAELSSLLTGRTPDVPAAAPVPVEKLQIRRENLITNSPFRIARRWGRDTATRQPLELHGFVGSGDKMEISLTNPSTRECHWVKLRDENAKWYVESADAKSRTAVVRMDGMSINLEMVKASETPMTTNSRFVPQAAVTIQRAPQPAQQNQAQRNQNQPRR